MTHDASTVREEVNFEALMWRAKVGDFAVVIFAFVLAAVVGIMNTAPNVTSDSGAYLSVEALLLRGNRLYSGVFDNKDPLFYYVNALFLSVAGPRGPAVAEATVLGIGGACAAWFAARRGAGWALATVVSILIPIALTSGPYIPGLTHSWGMAALLLAVLALLDGRYMSAGSLVAVAGLLELRTTAIGVAAAVGYVVVARGGPRVVARLCAGALTVGGSALVVLAIRGELAGYVEVQLYNLRHVEMVRELRHTNGPLPAVVRFGLRDISSFVPAELFLTLVVACAALVAIVGRRRVQAELRAQARSVDDTRVVLPPEVDAWVALVVVVSAVLVTSVTTLFSHHTQLIGLPLALGAVLAVVSLGRLQVPWAPGVAVVALLVLAFGLGGPWRSADRWDGWRVPLASPSAAAIDKAVPSGKHVYSIVGEVGLETAHAAFLDDRFEFACRLVYQHPWDDREFDEFVRCLGSSPDVVLLTQFDPVLESAFPTYAALHEQVRRVLGECFDMIRRSEQGVRTVYQRIPGCTAEPAPSGVFAGARR